MAEALRANVDLVKTIPPRMHERLRKAIAETFADQPFDQAALRELLRDQFRSTGYDLRRLTRDQNSKLVGALTEFRQTELGIVEYRWLTSQDERVRPTHVANSGRLFAWSAPSPTTGHPGEDIQCRCLAEGIVTREQRARITLNAAAMSPQSVL